VRADERNERGLAGHLLCAVPQLLDPNFHRAVVLLLEYGPDGALGLVLNNPMPTRMADVAQSLSLEWLGDPETLVRLGGPVEQVRGWFLHDQSDWDAEADSVAGGLWLTTSLESVKREGHLSFGEPDSRFVFLLGYAGWSGGQLEFEIAGGSWVVVPIVEDGETELGVDVDFLFECEPEDMWTAALQAIGVDPQRLVGMQGSATLH
jgi:putative transcriptional regulator